MNTVGLFLQNQFCKIPCFFALTVRLQLIKYNFHCASISSRTTGPIFLVFVSYHAAHWAAWEEVVCEKFNPQVQEEIDAQCDAHDLFFKWFTFIFVFFIFDDYLQKTTYYTIRIFINNTFNWTSYFYVILRLFYFNDLCQGHLVLRFEIQTLLFAISFSWFDTRHFV